MTDSTSNVFINCPFDNTYKPMFHALVFTVFDCGFVARCALEERDSGEVRIDKIIRIIEQCRYGIHDISCTELCDDNGLPRFNMPLELGMFIGAKKYGSEGHQKKKYTVLDRERYRFQKFISDIAGQDIQSHGSVPNHAIKAVRNWLLSVSKRKTIPTFKAIKRRYEEFERELPNICLELDLEIDDLEYNDFCTLVVNWLETSSSV